MRSTIGESLVQRARNYIASEFLRGTANRLFFIDADVSYSVQQFLSVARAVNPKENRGVVAGACPMKDRRLPLNFQVYPEDEKYFLTDEDKKKGLNGIKLTAGMIRMQIGHDESLIRVPLIGTAFMCIDRSVLEDLKNKVETYYYPHPMTGEDTLMWDFFPCTVQKQRYISEDWGFCELARKYGHDIILDTDVVVNHHGMHNYSVDIEAAVKEAAESLGALVAPSEESPQLGFGDNV